MRKALMTGLALAALTVAGTAAAQADSVYFGVSGGHGYYDDDYYYRHHHQHPYWRARYDDWYWRHHHRWHHWYRHHDWDRDDYWRYHHHWD